MSKSDLTISILTNDYVLFEDVLKKKRNIYLAYDLIDNPKSKFLIDDRGYKLMKYDDFCTFVFERNDTELIKITVKYIKPRNKHYHIGYKNKNFYILMLIGDMIEHIEYSDEMLEVLSTPK